MGHGKRLEQIHATLDAYHEALEVDCLGVGVDLLDLYRGKLSLRRVGVLIRRFSTLPGSALFSAIERAVQPPTDPTDEPDEQLEPHQVMQVLQWTQNDEMLRQIVIANHHLLSAWTGSKVEPFPHPWEAGAQSNEAERNRLRSEAFRSADASAARAVVAPPVTTPERS